MQLEAIKVVLFDIFGTLVDWRGSIVRMGESLATERGINGVDWSAFALAWRAGYRPGMERVQSGERPWTPLDVIHRERLDVILSEFSLGSNFTENSAAISQKKRKPTSTCSGTGLIHGRTVALGSTG